MAERIRIALSLYLFSVLGIFLIAVPWTEVWDRATLFLAPTALGGWIRSAWFRGLVSGLGGLNVTVAVREAAALWRSFRRSGGEGRP